MSSAPSAGLPCNGPQPPRRRHNWSGYRLPRHRTSSTRAAADTGHHRGRKPGQGRHGYRNVGSEQRPATMTSTATSPGFWDIHPRHARRLTNWR
jgi:hypothetical protein